MDQKSTGIWIAQSNSQTGHPKVRQALRLALFGLGLLLLQPALARRDDRQQTAHIQSKAFDGTQGEKGILHYKGAVLLTQGTLKVTGALATAYLDSNNSITRVVVTGSPAHIQQIDDSGNLMQGDAAKIDYDNVKQIAVLTGNAWVRQKGRGDARGDKLTYNTQTSQMTGESNGDGLVHMTFEPKPKPAAPAGAPATAPRHKHHHHGGTKSGAAAPAPASASSQAGPETTQGQP